MRNCLHLCSLGVALGLLGCARRGELPVPTFFVRQSAGRVNPGETVRYSVALAGTPGGAVPVGHVELLAVTSDGAKHVAGVFALKDGGFTCSFRVPRDAAPGKYSLEFAYGGPGANYRASEDYQ